MRANTPAFFLAGLGILFATILWSTVAFADTCPTGAHPVTTQAEVQAMTLAGIPNAQIGMCWNPNDANVGQAAAQAKQDLQSMWCGNSNAQCSYNGMTYKSTVEGLDPKFAACADKFMQALRQVSPGACINSAFRSTAHQACSCTRTCPNHSPYGCSGLCATPGHSYHQKGLAIDVGSVRISTSQFWGLALRFGIGNPTGLHRSDPYHIQVMNGGVSCASVGYMPTDNDVFVAGPMSSNPYFGYSANPLPSAVPAAPMTPIQSFIPTTPASAAGGTGTTQTPSGPASACTPSYSCTGGVYYYHSSACQDVTLQTCQYGCAGNACATATSTAATSTSASIDTSGSNSSSGDSGNSSSGSQQSVSDLINLYAASVSTSAVSATATPITLNQDLSSGVEQNTGASGNSSAQAPPADGSVYLPVGGSQTFTSGDLSQSPAGSSMRDFTAFNLLERLRLVLVRLLAVFTPATYTR